MAQTTYTRVLPDLTRATRKMAYEKLSLLLSHLPAYDIDLLSITVDGPTKTLTVTLTDPIPSADERKHVGVENE